MSGRMHIRFAPDMPAAAVEVVSPELESVGRVWLKPNGEASLEVPSEASFLRIHLPGGRIVTLDRPGSLDRSISYADLESRRPQRSAPAPPEPADDERGLRPAPADAVPDTPRWARVLKGLSHFAAHAPIAEPGFRLFGNHPIAASSEFRSASGRGGIRAVWHPPFLAEPYELRVDLDDLEARIRLPGDLAKLEAHSEPAGKGQWKIVVRVASTQPVADTVGGYLNRGDLHSAATLAASAETAEDLLQEKVEDPFAAAVGAYLLLRLRRIELLHDWTSNLAAMFPQIPDAAIIRGWHLIQAGDRQREGEIRDCFARALAAPLPVFTEGLQLLSEAARLLGPDYQSQLDSLNARSGVVEWSSPFTATILSSGGTRTIAAPALMLDVDYGQPEGGL